jgi:hypothetical protein
MVNEYCKKVRSCACCGAVKVSLYALLGDGFDAYFCSGCYDVKYKEFKKKYGIV